MDDVGDTENHGLDSDGTAAGSAVAGSTATALSLVIRGSVACVACAFCKQCLACLGCVGCTNCVGCVGCFNCSGLHNAVGLRNVHAA